jgi:hypothetical protein
VTPTVVGPMCSTSLITASSRAVSLCGIVSLGLRPPRHRMHSPTQKGALRLLPYVLAV